LVNEEIKHTAYQHINNIKFNLCANPTSIVPIRYRTRITTLSFWRRNETSRFMVKFCHYILI